MGFGLGGDDGEELNGLGVGVGSVDSGSYGVRVYVDRRKAWTVEWETEFVEVQAGSVRLDPVDVVDLPAGQLVTRIFDSLSQAGAQVNIRRQPVLKRQLGGVLCALRQDLREVREPVQALYGRNLAAQGL
ncbi:hypothetical protein [Streptomyces sp. NPDC000134]|uniref:hypothetical protein n=1 Tax=Streptomyces sp. NPDC000134 TaxID=3364536 RepID=UPI0036C183F8